MSGLDPRVSTPVIDERCICGDLEPAHARIHCPVHGLFAGLTREQLRDRAEAAEAERDAAGRIVRDLEEQRDDAQEELQAAEARCARLQQALDQLSELGPPMDEDEQAFNCGRHDEPDHDHEFYWNLFDHGFCVAWARAGNIAREALAGPGSEQSSLTESGVAGLPDTPADSQEPPAWETLHDGVLDLIDRKRADSQEDKT